jgi:replication factor C small subunit
MTVDDVLWVEKYRPRHIEDMVLNDEYKKTFKEWIAKKEIPHLLLVGKPGSGKSTLARILIDEISVDKRSDVLFLNGSASRGIDVVRNNIEEFLKTMSFGESKIKIVFIDEADYLTQEAQAALRNIIEKYSDTGRFLFTANYESKFDSAILSRMQVFQFKALSKEYIFDFVKDILEKENIEFDSESVAKVVTMYCPDVRKIINCLESNVTDGKISNSISSYKSIEKLCRSYFTDIVKSIQNNDNKKLSDALKNTNELLKDNELDYKSLYEDIFDDENTPSWAAIVVNRYSSTHLDSMIPRLNYIAMLYKVIEVGSNFRKL